MYKVGDLVYYRDGSDQKHYCIIKTIEKNESIIKIWGKWTTELSEINRVVDREGWMPIEKVYLEKSVQKNIKVYGISKFMDEINKKI